jgi:hypothetical protein
MKEIREFEGKQVNVIWTENKIRDEEIGILRIEKSGKEVNKEYRHIGVLTEKPGKRYEPHLYKPYYHPTLQGHYINIKYAKRIRSIKEL